MNDVPFEVLDREAGRPLQVLRHLVTGVVEHASPALRILPIQPDEGEGGTIAPRVRHKWMQSATRACIPFNILNPF